jgi:DNA-binding NarL/FixJ family response regulator
MVADDHPLVLLSVRRTLEGSEFVVVAEAQTGSQVLPLIHQTRPDLLLLDVWMPGSDGLRLIEQLAQRSPDLRVVVFTGDDDPDLVQTALRLGARGFLLKTVAITELPALLREVTTGQASEEPSPANEPAPADSESRGGLTSKELQVLTLVVEGLSNPEIAKRLWLSRETVKSHLSSIYRKLSVGSRTQATKAAYDLHLLDQRQAPDRALLGARSCRS